ncbi:unnamed protein product, partial [Brassica oleracea]
ATQRISFDLFQVCVVFCVSILAVYYYEYDHLPLLELVAATGNDDDGDDMPGMNSVSAKVDVGGRALEGAPTTLAGPSDLDTNKPPARASLKMAEKARMA